MNKVRSLKDYLGGFDIIALQETWLEREGERDTIRKLDKNFRWIAKAAEREKTKGRAKGGVLVGIRKEIEIDRVDEWKYGLILKEIHIEKEKKANIVVIYNNGKMKDVKDELEEVIDELVIEGNTIIIIGDFNARIGKWKINEEGELIESRGSADERLNTEGKRLLELCESTGANIKNGDTKGDWEGKQTYVGGEGNSVLDLVIEIESVTGSIIEEIRVEPRIESDHLPVEVYIGKKNTKGERKKKGG